jgi:hypothetical protein
VADSSTSPTLPVYVHRNVKLTNVRVVLPPLASVTPWRMLLLWIGSSNRNELLRKAVTVYTVPPRKYGFRLQLAMLPTVCTVQRNGCTPASPRCDPSAHIASCICLVASKFDVGSRSESAVGFPEHRSYRLDQPLKRRKTNLIPGIYGAPRGKPFALTNRSSVIRLWQAFRSHAPFPPLETTAVF